MPNDSFDTINRLGHVEYHINRFPTVSVELFQIVDMNGTRVWQFEWLKAGSPGGLRVQRTMEFQSLSETELVLRTADHGDRPVGS